jgi:M6 family metalloprotease-like protein
MTRPPFRFLPCLLLILSPVFLQGAAPPPPPELRGFRTVESAITAQVSKAAAVAGPAQPGYLGLQLAGGANGKTMVAEVEPNSAAAAAGLRPGDVLARVAGRAIGAPDDLRRVLTTQAAGTALEVAVLRDAREVVTKAVLSGPSRPLAFEDGEEPRKGKGWDVRRMRSWSKSVYRLAVVLIDYPDSKSNPAIKPKDWEDALFSKGTYTQKSATGQKVHGSMNDHYLEQSYGTFHIEGKAFPHVLVSKKRAEYGKQGSGRQALLTEALDLLLARDGKDALKDFDGVFFMYSGGRMRVARGSLYWPHRATVRHQGKSWPYFICPEGGDTMYDISVLSHEFGHMLGLPDLYARPENPGSEGLGQWCLMSNQTPRGRPQHMSAWCKERLGWLKPTVIDPAVPQKLVLSPVYKSPRECYKVLAKPDGSEYFLLENRTATGFDASLPGHGLLVWRVVRGRPILEESHGIAGPAGPRSFPGLVPYPSKANDAFTPFTVPSSRTQLGGGTPVHITNIRRLPDGRITFYIGYEFF